MLDRMSLSLFLSSLSLRCRLTLSSFSSVKTGLSGITSRESDKSYHLPSQIQIVSRESVIDIEYLKLVAGLRSFSLPSVNIAIFRALHTRWVRRLTTLPESISARMTIEQPQSKASEDAPLSQDVGTSPKGMAGKKLFGREFYKSLGSPTMILAPMVDRSEFVSTNIALMYGMR